MFTGIVEEVGKVAGAAGSGTGLRLSIACSRVLEDAFGGASIAVNGVCLTVTSHSRQEFTADVAPETLRRSTLARLTRGDSVNLERPVSPSGRLGGHIVQGHIDGRGRVLSLELLGDQNWWLRFEYPDELDHYIVFKGSIAIDGMSLTIADAGAGVAAVTIVPHTYRSTILPSYSPGTEVNLECDVLAKYVEKMLGTRREAIPLTLERLREQGY